jgi:CDP-diacylglycerol--serine O-phosphatidyltransferase
MKLKQHIPNAITCCNLFCGCLAILSAFENNLIQSAYLVGLAAIFDFFDGFAARLLRVTSAIGKDLDSLADMVTFGLVPGVVMYKLLLIGITNHNATHQTMIPIEFAISAFSITIFSAIRLAKFNNDTRQTSSFIGVPTPAVAIFICSLPLITDQAIITQLFNPFLLIGLSILFSFLLISELPLFALKFKSFGWKGNRVKYIFLSLSVLLIALLNYSGIAAIIILYIITSIITHLYSKRV